MIQYICDICNKPTDNAHELCINSIHTELSCKYKKHICEECCTKLKTHIDNMISQTESSTTSDSQSDNQTTQPEMLDEEKIPKFYDYTQEYKNTTLREFLSSPFYLNSNEHFIFRNPENQIIQDYKFWMSRKILTVHPPTAAHKEIIVTLI